MIPENISPNTIGFDFDGVIADIGEAFLRIACEEYDYCSFRLEDITSFKVEACVDIPYSIVDTIFDDILADSLTSGLLPMPGALDIITDITKKSNLTIITARDLDEPVGNWFGHYLSDDICSRIDIIAMSDHDRKVEYIKQQGLQYFIDDRAETCAMVAEAGFTPILFRQPWNYMWNTFTTVENWNQIAEMLLTE